MAENQPSTGPSPTGTQDGIWILDKTGEHLEFKSEVQLARDSRESNESTTLDYPSDEAITEYLTHLSQTQQKYYDDLRALGWDNASIHNLLTLLQNTRKHVLAQLRMDGKSDEDIERRSALCDADITDYSHMKRPLADRAEEEYQTQLYLLEEAKRQRKVMLGVV